MGEVVDEGSIIANRFVVEKPVARGGMGAIFRARDLKRLRLVALKLSDDYAPARRIDRIMHEAAMLKELHHPGIVSHVSHGHTKKRQPFLAMELLEGEDLAQHLRAGVLGLAATLRLGRRIGDAMTFAHRRGIVHRDLKPSNLFLQNGQVERVTILDFGVAHRALDSVHTESVVGTLGYMAPEQARAEGEVGPCADVFSLGCVLFECLAGEPPFVGQHPSAVLAKIVFQERPRLRSLRPELPQAVDDLLDRMLSKYPRRRPQGAALQAALAALESTVSSSQAAPETAPVALGDKGRGFVTILAATTHREISHLEMPTIDTVEMLRIDSRRDVVEEALDRHRVRGEWLPDGTLVAIADCGNVADGVARVVRCALEVRAHWPEAKIAVTTERTTTQSRIAISAAIERACQKSKSMPASESVRLDGMTAGDFDVDKTQREWCHWSSTSSSMQ